MKNQTLHSEFVKLGNRNLFVDIKQSEKGSSYLTLNISKKQKDGSYEQNKIVIFENEMTHFAEGIMRAMVNFKKTGRDAAIESARQKYPNAFSPWTKKADQELANMVVEEQPIAAIAQHFGRNENSIKARIEKLNLATAAPSPA